jgi:hypothetical protein
MGTDLQLRPGQFLHPGTGEVLDLATAGTDEIAEAVWILREQVQRLRDWQRIAGEEILRRMDQSAKWTLHEGQYTLKGDSPAPTREVDLEPLRRELSQLIDEGKVAATAAERALEAKVVYKPKWNGIDALRKLGGEVKERIDKHIREVEKQRKNPTVTLARPQ